MDVLRHELAVARFGFDEAASLQHHDVVAVRTAENRCEISSAMKPP